MEELEAEQAERLPDREAMSTLDPTAGLDPAGTVGAVGDTVGGVVGGTTAPWATRSEADGGARHAATGSSRTRGGLLGGAACSTSTSTSTSPRTRRRRSAPPWRPTRTSRRRSTPRSSANIASPDATSAAVATQHSTIVQHAGRRRPIADVDQNSDIGQGEVAEGSGCRRRAPTPRTQRAVDAEDGAVMTASAPWPPEPRARRTPAPSRRSRRRGWPRAWSCSGSTRAPGFKEPPHLARRGDGQVIQLTRLLHLVAEAADGRRDIAEIAASCPSASAARVSADNVDVPRRPEAAPARRAGAARRLHARSCKKADPLLALRHRTALVPPGAVNRLARVLRPAALARRCWSRCWPP